ncbi:AAA family ATPase [Paenibacillus polymyxa]|uniref:AAA family ATPase n=1 Tax=Paenibacillus polymyxa TaxID=1406 RepID=UPI001484EAB7|nr:AAA family ATPase [Paenibacillus polymyxa]
MDFENMSSMEKIFLVNLYFAKKKSSDPEYKHRKVCYEELSKRYDKKFYTIRNNQDRLDPLFDNGRMGWHKEPLEKQNKQMYNLYMKYRDINDEELKNMVDNIMSTDSDTMYFFSIRTKTPSIVNAIKKSESNIEVDGLNILSNQLKVGQTIFIVFGGDQGKLEVTWDTGLSGIGHIVSEPYDFEGKNYKIKIDVDYLLNRAMKREDLLQYRNAYNIIGIGPMTKWEPNQAISQISESKAATLVRAILDKYPVSESCLEEIFGEAFVGGVKEDEEYLLVQSLPFGSAPLTNTISVREDGPETFSSSFDPNISTIMFNFEMNDRPVQSLRNFINMGKHIILTGPPGTGKTTIAERTVNEAVQTNFISGSIITTATSDWSTFDTIGGFMPTENGKLEFHEGIVLRSLRENNWLIIDEINRAEIDKAFGPLFTLLSGKDVELLFQIDGEYVKVKNSNELNSYFRSGTYYVGRNWRIIGTMNTYDKNSLFSLSYAFMRRFAFIELPIPDAKFIYTLIESSNIKPKGIQFVKDVFTVSPRPLGPSIILELIKYLEITDSEGFLDGLCGVVTPQFEGLTPEKLRVFFGKIIKYLDESEKVEFQKYLCDFFEIAQNYLVIPSLSIEVDDESDEDSEDAQ